MATGEYVSVSSQTDTENADLAREKQELEKDSAFERACELKETFEYRGRLDPEISNLLTDDQR
jgi:VIT1/CCC1 family predicted Fe2+/Mn2+ transporter